MQYLTPTLDQIQALDGRDFAMLSTVELEVLKFYRNQGRKFDVAISIVNKAHATCMAHTMPRSVEDGNQNHRNSFITVAIGPAAESAWLERAIH